jgi:hypothetical protein
MRGLTILLAVAFAQAQAPAPATEKPRTLTVTYSDGRIAPRIVTPYGASWSPNFPHRPDAPKRDGLALSGLKVEHRAEADGVVVTVSLAYGQPAQHIVQVTTIRLRDSQTVRVEALTSFGVDPITLALDAAAPALVVVPKATSVSAMLDVTVDLLSNDLPLYEVTLQNRSTVAITALAFRAYRGETAVLSGMRGHNRSFPALEAGGRLQFKTQAARHEGPQGFDRFEVTGVLWSDGTLEGDATLATHQRSLTIGRANQLRRIVALLRENGGATVSEIRAAVEKLPVNLSDGEVQAIAASGGGNLDRSYIEAGQSYVRTAVLDDLKAYIETQSANPNAPAPLWVRDAMSSYSAWLDRTGVR